MASGHMRDKWVDQSTGLFEEVGFFVTGIVASMGFPTFVADHGCVSSPPNMIIHMALVLTKIHDI